MIFAGTVFPDESGSLHLDGVRHVGSGQRCRSLTVEPNGSTGQRWAVVITTGAAEEAVEAIKTAAGWSVGWIFAEVPLADETGSISQLLKTLGEGGLLERESLTRSRREVHLVTESLRVSAGEESGARGAAHRGADISLLADDTLLGDLIDARGLDRFQSGEAKIGISRIVGEQDHHRRSVEEALLGDRRPTLTATENQQQRHRDADVAPGHRDADVAPGHRDADVAPERAAPDARSPHRHLLRH